MSDSRKRLADGAFLIALMLYILAGVGLVPLHGDEVMQMGMARDVFSALHGDWQQLAYTPPIQPGDDQDLRLINGVINKSLIGLAWMVDGRSSDSLPAIFYWGETLDWNRQHGYVPTLDAIRVARWPSALLTAFGVIPVFLLGWQLRLRSLAYPAALLYALHPVILLNGRRAMMEGSLMLFTLLTMYWLIGMIIAEHSAVSDGFIWRLPLGVRYGVFGLLIGLTVASKYTGIVVAIAGLSAVLAAGLMRRSRRSIGQALVGVCAAGLIAISVWFILNPAYWNNPAGALRYMLNARVVLLDQQTRDNPLDYQSFGERLRALVVQPFLTPPQYYEAVTWTGQIDDSISTYQLSTLDGWDWGMWIGLILTILAVIGLMTLVYDALHRDLVAWAILIWTGATVISSLAIPMAWQRYYLPLMLVTIILAATGLGRLFVRHNAEQSVLPRIELTPELKGEVS